MHFFHFWHHTTHLSGPWIYNTPTVLLIISQACMPPHTVTLHASVPTISVTLHMSVTLDIGVTSYKCHSTYSVHLVPRCHCDWITCDLGICMLCHSGRIETPPQSRSLTQIHTPTYFVQKSASVPCKMHVPSGSLLCEGTFLWVSIPTPSRGQRHTTRCPGYLPSMMYKLPVSYIAIHKAYAVHLCMNMCCASMHEVQ